MSALQRLQRVDPTDVSSWSFSILIIIEISRVGNVSVEQCGDEGGEVETPRRRILFRGSNLTIYLSLWNVLNRRNVAAVYWNKLGRKPGEITGWGLLPVLGVEFEF